MTRMEEYIEKSNVDINWAYNTISAKILKTTLIYISYTKLLLWL